MSEGKKIIDLRRDATDAEAQLQAEADALLLKLDEPAGASIPSPDNAYDSDSDDRPRVAPTTWLVVLLGLAWTGFVGWLQAPLLVDGVKPSEFAGFMTLWSPTIAFLTVGYLVLQRNGSAEIRRYAHAAQGLRQESYALETRLASINNELALAREFLASQGQALESIGRISIDRIGQNAQALAALIDSSDKGVREISAVSGVAKDNMEQLRSQLPVIANAVKDVTSQFGNAGRTAQNQLDAMIAAFDRLSETSAASKIAVEALASQSGAVSKELSEASMTMVAHAEQASASIGQQQEALAGQLDVRIHSLSEQLTALADTIDSRAVQSRVVMDQSVEQLNEALVALQGSTFDTQERIGDTLHAIEAQMRAAEGSLVSFDQQGSEAVAKLAFALDALAKNITDISAHFDQGETRAANFVASADALRLSLNQSEHSLAETLPSALITLASQAEQNESSLGAIAEKIGTIQEQSDALAAMLGSIAEQAANHGTEITRLSDTSMESWQSQTAQITALIEAMQAARTEAIDLSESAGTRLSETLRDVQREASLASQEVRRALSKAILDAVEQLDEETSTTLENVVRIKSDELLGRLDHMINRAVGATTEASSHMKDQLTRVDELTALLERRIRDAREAAEEPSDHDFSRRVALLTESLNSLSIDIAKVLSTEVSDTAWAAYLKGDRGVFTRRAVRLIDAGEAKDIAQAYRNDSGFSEQVNRYVHDFEAILRTLLSTRDGGVMSVTLLSSDMGKLYVALAQAIERFRD